MDKFTKDRIQKLHPSVHEEMERIITECDKALTGRAKIRITQGLRTWVEQSQLYAKGRTKSGLKVTNAKSGQSIHNYGLAVDICLIIDGKMASWDIHKDWDNDKIADWKECVQVFNKYGWDWGGNWKTFKDFAHFEKRNIIVKSKTIKATWQNLINLPKDKSGYIIF